MKLHEKIAKARELTAQPQIPYIAARALGGQTVRLADVGASLTNDGDYLTVVEMHEFIAWLIDEFDYKPEVKKAKARK